MRTWTRTSSRNASSLGCARLRMNCLPSALRWTPSAEASPRRSPTSCGWPRERRIALLLRELEAEQTKLDEQIANAGQAAATRRALRATTREAAQEMLAGWIAED